MAARLWMVLGSLLVLCATPAPMRACILCNPLQGKTLRQDAADAKLVVYGSLDNAKPGPDGVGGTTDLLIEKVLKNDPSQRDKKVIQLPRYIPFDTKKPPKYLVFCDVVNDKLDPFRGVPAKTEAVKEYLKGAIALDGKDRIKTLCYFFDYLDHTDAVVAEDAFFEFAKATDHEVSQLGGKLSAAKLRGWIVNPKTPATRLGLYGYLLGRCGKDTEADLLRSLVEKPTKQTLPGLSGLLCGYIELRSEEGWDLAVAMLREKKRPFLERFGVLGAVRFYQSLKPEKTRREALRCLEVLVDQGDMADLAIEDLRRWRLWDLTDSVLAQYGKKSHAAPIVRRAILRYALSCPKDEASSFVAEQRKQNADLVSEVEESLQPEKLK